MQSTLANLYGFLMNGEALPPITGRTPCIRTEAIDEMNVSGLGSAATATYAQSTTRRTPPPLTTTAKLLGVSTDQLTKDLQSGTTLSSLASQKGVSSSALLTSVESDLQANAPTGSTASSSQLAQVATNLIQGGGGHHHRHGGGGEASTHSACWTAPIQRRLPPQRIQRRQPRQR